MAEDLTTRQRQILEFIKAYIQKSGFSPTIFEIKEKFSFRSPNAVQEHLKALERKGYIRRHPNRWRGLEVAGPSKRENEVLSVPLVGGIAAGAPLLAEENIEGTVSVDRSLVGRATKLFALRVRGASMIKVGICGGDIIIVQQQSVANQGDIVVALLGDEATVKRFQRRGRTILLRPENDSMQPVEVGEGDDLRILGKVIATLRRIKAA